jgi:ABC-type branched-subunit amino acid transport system ATPase component
MTGAPASTGEARDAVLVVSGVSKRFRGVVALDDVSLSVAPGTVHCIIGPNGAGKTTLFNVLSGTERATGGQVRFRGEDITRLPVDRISRMGLVRTFQTPRAILTFGARANVGLALAGRGARNAALRLLLAREPPPEEAEALLERVGLAVPDVPVSELSHGDRKRLELAVALACRPEVLLLDEPTSGMNEEETTEMAEIMRGLAGELTLVVIEHDLDFVRRMAERVSVLHQGRVLTQGSVAEVEADQRVRDVYLGAA